MPTINELEAAVQSASGAEKSEREGSHAEQVHHILCKYYGAYIPIEVFKKEPLTTLLGCLRQSKIDLSESEEKSDKIKGKWSKPPQGRGF